MNKNLKTLIILTIFIIIILAILLLIMIFLKKENKMNDVGEVPYTDQDIHIRNEVEKVILEYDYFDTIACIEKYINILNKINIDNYQDSDKNLINETVKYYKEDLLAILDEQYKKENNINNIEELDKNLEEYYKYIKFKVNSMYVIDNENISFYFVYGQLIDISNNSIKEYGFIVKRDTQDLMFSIYPYEYMIEKNYLENTIGTQNLQEILITKVENNYINNYTSDAYDYEYISTYYFNMYKQDIEYNIKGAYEMINENYREKRFGSFEKYKQYVKENYKEILSSKLALYQLKKYDDYKEYIIKDQYDNIYVFKENTVGDYTLMLDTYTLEQEKFLTSYKNASNKEKVLMNLDKFFQMINSKDYSAAYNVLDDNYKDTYFKTEESFKEFIKTYLYSHNVAKYMNFSNEISGIYTYHVEISNIENELSPKIKMDIIMSLLEGTDFKMSFSIVQ